MATDNKSDKQREIDDFLSKFDNPYDKHEASDAPSVTEAAATAEEALVDSGSVDAATAAAAETGNDSDAAGTIGETADGTDVAEATVAIDEEAATVAEDAAAVTENAGETSGTAVNEATKVIDTQDAAAIAASAVTADASAGKDTGLPEDYVKKSSDSDDDDLFKTLTSGLEDKTKKDDSKANKAAAGSGKSLRDRLSLSLFVKNPDYDPDAGEFIMVNGKKKKNKKTKFSFKRLIKDFILLCLVGVLAGLVYSFAVISTAPKIEPEKIYDKIAESSIIYDDEGNKIDTVFYTQNRTLVSYDEMPRTLIDSFVALEDKTFWDHHGFNWIRMFGAVFQSITGHGRISGTSTITQQLARNVYLPDIKSQRSIRRKVLEMYYASQLERKLSKKQIIEAYLNSIYLGFGCYGVDSAAQAYFSKDVKDLYPVECAALAALPQAPDTYALIRISDGEASEYETAIVQKGADTYVANDLSKDRRNTCLDLMLEQGYINQSTYDAAYNKPLTEFIKPSISDGNSTLSYFSEYMLDEVAEDLMEEYDISYEEAERMIYTGGLNIYSTIDIQAQQVIIKEFNDASNFPYLQGYYTDDAGNLYSNGTFLCYDNSKYFDSSGNFVLNNAECKINEDGSVTVLRDHRLNIYTTEYDGKVDYSLEFKNTYSGGSGALYMYPGGYINIPAKYKSLDENDDLVISGDYFTNNPDQAAISGDTVIFKPAGYTLSERVIQPQAAMVIVEVGSGQVKAMVGGRGTTGKRLYNRATSTRQPGSSLKPLGVYSAALQRSFDYASQGQKFPYYNTGHDSQGTKYFGDYLTAASVIIDEPMTFNGQSWPKNAGGGYSGAVTMRKALQQSINTCAVKIQLQVGNEYSADMIKKFGITTLVTEADPGEPDDMNPAALALGGLTYGVKPIEMAQAYATFPNGGVRNSSISYTKVTDRNGKVLLENKSETTKVLDPGVAWIMTDMLKSVVSQGIAGAAATYAVASGGKTGTTSDQYDIWFDGFTPTYAAALWIGCDVNIELSSMSGTTAALWGRIMNQIPKAMTGSYKEAPSNVIYRNGEYFTSGTETGLSNYIQELKKKQEEEKKKKEEEEKKKKEAEEKARQEAERARQEAEKQKQEQQDPENPGDDEPETEPAPGT